MTARWPSPAQLEPLDAAQIQLGLAQSVNELFKLYLRAAGTDPSDHPVKHEAVRACCAPAFFWQRPYPLLGRMADGSVRRCPQERLQQYSLRVAKAVNARDLANSRRSLAVDIGAANRFIEHAIPELTDDQKQRLRQAGPGPLPLPRSWLLPDRRTGCCFDPPGWARGAARGKGGSTRRQKGQKAWQTGHRGRNPELKEKVSALQARIGSRVLTDLRPVR